MPDWEKVIEILEKAKTIIEGWVPMFEQYNTPAGIDYAIALLKAQEPEEPKIDELHMVYKCPACDVFLRPNQKYCDWCGKAVKWDA